MVRIDITDELVEKLTTRALMLGLGFKSSTEAVNDAIRKRIEQFDSAIIHRKNVDSLKVEKVG